MRVRAFIVACFVLTSCDDHIIGEAGAEIVSGENVYDSNWAGVELLFVDYCDVCHSDGGSGGFDLHTTIAAELNGGDPYYVVPGDASGSAVWQAMTGTGALSTMPPTGVLETELIAHVEEWINDGAPQ